MFYELQVIVIRQFSQGSIKCTSTTIMLIFKINYTNIQHNILNMNRHNRQYNNKLKELK